MEKLPPIHMVHRGPAPVPHRVVVLPTECAPVELVTAMREPRAWCTGVDAVIGAEPSFRGMEVVDLSRLPARERTRTVVEVTASTDGAVSERRRVTVAGPTYSDVDMLTQRALLDDLRIDGLVRVSAARTATWPVRTLAAVRIVRPGDAALVAASVRELEVSRAESEAKTLERATRCAIEGLPK